MSLVTAVNYLTMNELNIILYINTFTTASYTIRTTCKNNSHNKLQAVLKAYN